jgi:hypothetical protein
LTQQLTLKNKGFLMINNRVSETSTSTGTGNFTLAGAAANFKTFANSYALNLKFSYGIIDDDNSAWEIGHGYLSDSTTLVREKVLSNSAGTTASIDFGAGTKKVFSSVGMHDTSPAMPGVRNLDTRGICSAHLRYTGYGDQILSGNKLNYYPFQLPVGLLCSGVRYEVGATTGSSQCRFAIYSINSDGTPGRKLIESQDMTVDSTAVHVVNWAADATILLGPGWYYTALGASSSGNPALKRFTSLNGAFSPLGVQSGDLHPIAYVQENLTASWTSLPATAGSFVELGYTNGMQAHTLVGTLV